MGPKSKNKRKNADMNDDDDLNSSNSNKRGRQKSPPNNSFNMDESQDEDNTSQSQSTPQEISGPEDIKALLLYLVKKVDGNLQETKGMRKDLKEIKDLVTSHERRLHNTEVRVENVESSLQKLELENEDIRKELNKINLIVEGIPDTEDETEDELYGRVKYFLSNQIEQDVSFDNAYRLGKPRPDYRRPIRVRFMTMLQRNIVYQNRSKAKHPFYVNEDLPFTTRRDYGILRKKKRDTIQKGVPADQVKIDYKNKTIAIGNTRQSIKQGFLQAEPSTSTSAQRLPYQNDFLGNK
jgi:hypothetical protein